MVTLPNRELLEAGAPSIFTEEPAERVSKRYMFLPTTRIIEILGEEGWKPWRASQVKPRDPKMKPFARHLVRFRHEDLSLDSDVKVGDLFPELLLVNSHDALCSYRLHAGVFRMVCSNGLVVADEDFGRICVRHQGFNEEELYEASRAFCENIQPLNSSINDWRKLRLTVPQIETYTRRAAKVRFTDPDKSIVANLAVPHREEDMQNDLWHVFNVVEENLLNGGFLNESTRRRVRPIKSIKKDIDINKELWAVTSKYYDEIT